MCVLEAPRGSHCVPAPGFFRDTLQTALLRNGTTVGHRTLFRLSSRHASVAATKLHARRCTASLMKHHTAHRWTAHLAAVAGAKGKFPSLPPDGAWVRAVAARLGRMRTCRRHHSRMLAVCDARCTLSRDKPANATQLRHPTAATHIAVPALQRPWPRVSNVQCAASQVGRKRRSVRDCSPGHMRALVTTAQRPAPSSTASATGVITHVTVTCLACVRNAFRAAFKLDSKACAGLKRPKGRLVRWQLDTAVVRTATHRHRLHKKPYCDSRSAPLCHATGAQSWR